MPITTPRVISIPKTFILSSEEMSKTYKGSCHCGNIKFEIDSDLAAVRSCDCSICVRRGALNHRVEESQFRLLKPAPSSLEDGTHGLTVYQFNLRIAKDYFCPVCGISPFRRPRTAPQQWSVNVRCLEGVVLEDLNVVKVFGSRLSVVEGSVSESSK
jgi:hypothetical protein